MACAPAVASFCLLWFSDIPVWVLCLLAVPLAWALFQVVSASAGPDYLRWSGSDVVLFEYRSPVLAERYAWSGRGRRNSLYLRLVLACEQTGQRRTLMIWRDSVSDPSWRSLNAWFRIQAAAVRRDHTSQSRSFLYFSYPSFFRSGDKTVISACC
jgi:hypothetical protein